MAQLCRPRHRHRTAAIGGKLRPAPRNEFLPISMPIVALVPIDLLDMAVLRLTLARSQHHSPMGQEHGRTIPLTVFESRTYSFYQGQRRRCVRWRLADHAAAGATGAPA